MREPVAGKIRSQVESVFTKVKFVIRILLRLNYALIGFCIHTFMNTVSTKNMMEQRTVLCTHRYSNSHPPDLWNCVFTTTTQRPTCLIKHSSFHYLLSYDRSINIYV